MPPPTLIRPATPEEAARAEYRSNQVDAYGEVKRRLDLCKPDQDLAGVLKDEIEGWHEDKPGDKGQVEVGRLYLIQLSPKCNQRTVTDKKKAFHVLKKAVGIDALIALIQIPFGAAIDANIPKSKQKLFVVEERSGYRTLSVVALHQAAAAELKAA